MNLLIASDYPDRPEIALYRELHKKGDIVTIVCNPRDQIEAKLGQPEISVHPLTIRSRLDFRAVRFMRHQIQTGKHDVIYATSKRTLTHCLLAATGTKVPIVAYRGIMGNVSIFNPEAYFGYSNKRVRKIICVCDAVRNSLLSRGFSTNKVQTVYKGHDPSWYNNNASTAIFSEFGIPSDSFVITCVAQMRPRKGILVLLDALRFLPPNSAHILLVGKITDSRITRFIEEKHLSNMVHCAGFRSDATVLAGASSLSVMPSLKREGLPKTVIEAMIQGVPAVVTDVGGMPELVEHNKSGLIVKPSDARALADSIAFFLNSPEKCRQFGKEARKRMISHFSVKATVEKTIKIFKEAITES